MGDTEVQEIKIGIVDDFPCFQSETCIGRVPSSIRRVNVASYTPKVISIGPLHHGKPDLQKIETEKEKYLESFCGRVPKETQVKEGLRDSIRGCQKQILGSYEDCWEVSNDEFVEMILLDAVFILEFFIRWDNGSHSQDDFISVRAHTILSDLKLLENQIPYFLLNRLYDETLKPKYNDEFDGLVWRVLADPYAPMKPYIFEGVKHFVDLLRKSLLNDNSIEPKPVEVRKLKLKHCARKLYQAGVEFEGVNRAENPRFDLEFKNGVLKIPAIEVRDYSELEFLNLMAFEHKYYPSEVYIRNFLFLMNYLIENEKDVELLTDAGVVIHRFGSNRIFVDFIKKLCHGMNDDKTCYADLYKQLNQQCEKWWSPKFATLKRAYFSNLWKGTGTVAAVFLLLLTLTQTICSLLSL